MHTTVHSLGNTAIKDNKTEFPNKTKCRLPTPTKTYSSIKVLSNLINRIKYALKLNQWKNDSHLANWFNKITYKVNTNL